MKYFLLTIAVLFTFSINGQYRKSDLEKYKAKYGVKILGGYVNLRPETTYVGNERDQIVHQIALTDATPQMAIGLWGQKRFGWLYAEGNILYSHYGMNFDVTTYMIENIQTRRMQENFGYLDLQIMGGVISNGFRLAVGPVMHLLVNQNSELTTLSNYNQKLRDVSYGFSVGIGYDIGRFSFDLKYDKAFRTIGDHIYYRYKKSQFLETPDSITFSIAYAIFY